MVGQDSSLQSAFGVAPGLTEAHPRGPLPRRAAKSANARASARSPPSTALQRKVFRVHARLVRWAAHCGFEIPFAVLGRGGHRTLQDRQQHCLQTRTLTSNTSTLALRSAGSLRVVPVGVGIQEYGNPVVVSNAPLTQRHIEHMAPSRFLGALHRDRLLTPLRHEVLRCGERPLRPALRPRSAQCAARYAAAGHAEAPSS